MLFPELKRDKISKPQKPYDGFVRNRRGKLYVDRSKKLGSILTNEIILNELMRFLKANFPEQSALRVLDAGAGTRPYAILYERYFSSCVSFDTFHSEHNITSIDLIASCGELPFQNETFDCIICTEVLEHVPEPVAVLKEFRRVLKTGGRLFLTTPFLVPLHEMPYDFFRYTPSALHSMSARAALTVNSIHSKGDYFAVVLLSLQYPFTKFWQALSRLLHVSLYHPYNPLVFLTIVLPQLLYLTYWRRINLSTKETFGKKLYRKLSYITVGYITTLSKAPETCAA